MNNIMLDIETLGTSPGSAILSIGAVYFGDEGLGHEFYRAIDLFSSLMAGATVNTDTIAWWREQSPEAKAVAQPMSGKVTLGQALDAFSVFASGRKLWAKGPDFDIVLLDAMYQRVGKRKPWHYRDVRDVRTILAISKATNYPTATVEHSALADAIEQAECVRIAFASLGLALA